MKTLAERVKEAMDAKPCSGTELASASGVKPPSVSDWLSGKTKTLKSATALRASRFLGVNMTWLTEGVGRTNQLGEPIQGGIWYPDSPDARRDYEAVRDAGNEQYGAVTHWIEEREV